jgi:hypothetical protein
MPQTATISTGNEVFPTLALSTTEDFYEFVLPSGGSRLYSGSVQLRSNGDWLYSHQAGGPYYPVYAREILKLDGVYDNMAIFVKAVSGTPTLYAMEGIGRGPAVKA